MTVLAIGATGAFAGLVVPALVSRGITVRAMVHDAAKADLPRANGAQQVVQADLRDTESLAAAVNGVNGIFLITPAFNPDATQMGLDVVAAAVRAGVRKVVYSGVYHPSLSLVNHASTRPIEEALYRSDLAFVILQPAMYMQGLRGPYQRALRTGTVVMPWSRASKMTYVDYRDVAEVAATGFATDILDHGTYELAAHGTYDRVQIAALMSEAAGRPLIAEDTADHPPAQPDGLTDMFHEYDQYGFHGGNDLVLRTILQRAPRTLSAYVFELRGATP